jgi:hypothetical protein
MTTTLTLGDIQFEEYEIPEHIAVQTSHKAAVHRLVGGARQIDMLGVDHAPLKWSGWFVGESALERALALKQINDAGLPVKLSWSEFLYDVVVTSFEADYQRDYQIPYSIEVTVIEDHQTGDASASAKSILDQITEDISSANALAEDFPALTKARQMFNDAVGKVTSFISDAQEVIHNVAQRVDKFRADVQEQLVLVDKIIEGIEAVEKDALTVATLGGLLPNNALARRLTSASDQLNASLHAQRDAIDQQLRLVQLYAVLGRLKTNLEQIDRGVKSVSVGGNTLFDLASKYYGKVSGWTALLKANPHLGNDPNITGNQVITIPPYRRDSGGILGG